MTSVAPATEALAARIRDVHARVWRAGHAIATAPDEESRTIARRNCDIQLELYAAALDALGATWRMGVPGG